MCEYFVKADPIQYEQRSRTIRIHGVLTRPGMQIIFADLPGIHSKQPKAINRYMNRMALASLADADVNLFVIEALRWTDEDERALEELRAAKRPILLLINKVDRAHPKDRLLPFIAELSQKAEFAEVVPLSATSTSWTASATIRRSLDRASMRRDWA